MSHELRNIHEISKASDPQICNNEKAGFVTSSKFQKFVYIWFTVLRDS